MVKNRYDVTRKELPSYRLSMQVANIIKRALHESLDISSLKPHSLAELVNFACPK